MRAVAHGKDAQAQDQSCAPQYGFHAAPGPCFRGWRPSWSFTVLVAQGSHLTAICLRLPEQLHSRPLLDSVQAGLSSEQSGGQGDLQELSSPEALCRPLQALWALAAHYCAPRRPTISEPQVASSSCQGGAQRTLPSSQLCPASLVQCICFYNS